MNQLEEIFLFNSDILFSKLPENTKDDFRSQMKIRQYKKGQNIFTEGTYPAGIYFIVKGKVKKYKTLNDGKAQIIYICTAGELLGYASLLSEERYPDSAAALTNSTIGFISKEKLLQLLDNYDELYKMLLKNLSHEFGVLVNFIAVYSQKTAREKIALTLLILQEKFKENVNEQNQIQIELTREDFANIVGIAVETLVRFLHEFKEEKLIRTQGRKIFLLNEKHLFQIANI